MWTHWNPVRITFGAGSFDTLPDVLGGRGYLLVTYPDPFAQALRARIEVHAGPPALVIDDVAPNPDFTLLADQVARCRGLRVGAVVALGGGSVIDSAKVLAAADGDFGAVRDYLLRRTGAERLGAVPIVAVPTTAGTGSEVTSWGTVWDSASGAKHSLALPQLYPEAAVVDPALMLSKPRDLTVSTGLDALSHALESIWNKNANPVSVTFAVAAARAILEVLPRLAEELSDPDLRARMAQAALLAGLAFSATKTAIAHSISYPVTLRHGVVHGVACSFTLPVVIRSLNGASGLCAEGLDAVFGTGLAQAADRVEEFLGALGVATAPGDYGIGRQEMLDLVATAFEGERGQNFVGQREDMLAVMSA